MSSDQNSDASGEDYVLGIDGGGSSTVVWLALRKSDRRFEKQGTGQAGPSNLNVVGFDQASQNVETAIQIAFDSAGLKRQPVGSICLAMAGCDRDAQHEQWQQWAGASQLASGKIVIANDAIPVIFAANANGHAVALIAGTGSLALGRNVNGKTARSGGWGPLIGDEGSGYAIGITGLKAAVLAADGRGQATELLPRFCESLGVDDPSQIVSVIYSPAYDRPKIASLASIVFDASADGDAVACGIIQQESRELSLMIRAVVRQLDIDPSSSMLAITGGVALGQPDYVDQITAHLSDQSIVFSQTSLQRYPVAGAVQMAINEFGS